MARPAHSGCSHLCPPAPRTPAQLKPHWMRKNAPRTGALSAPYWNCTFNRVRTYQFVSRSRSIPKLALCHKVPLHHPCAVLVTSRVQRSLTRADPTELQEMLSGTGGWPRASSRFQTKAPSAHAPSSTPSRGRTCWFGRCTRLRGRRHQRACSPCAPPGLCICPTNPSPTGTCYE